VENPPTTSRKMMKTKTSPHRAPRHVVVPGAPQRLTSHALVVGMDLSAEAGGGSRTWTIPKKMLMKPRAVETRVLDRGQLRVVDDND
jgi:hypothetical protein